MSVMCPPLSVPLAVPYPPLPPTQRRVRFRDLWGLSAEQIELIGLLAKFDQDDRERGGDGLSMREIARRVGARRERIAPFLSTFRKVNTVASSQDDYIRREVDAARTAPGPGNNDAHRKPNGHVDWDQLRDENPVRAKAEQVVVASSVRKAEAPE